MLKRPLMIMMVWITKQRKLLRESLKYLKAGEANETENQPHWKGFQKVLGRKTSGREGTGMGATAGNNKHTVLLSQPLLTVRKHSPKTHSSYLFKWACNGSGHYAVVFRMLWPREKAFNRDDAGDRKRGGLNTEVALVLIEGYTPHVPLRYKHSTHAISMCCMKFVLMKASSQCHRGFLLQSASDKKSGKKKIKNQCR